MKNLKPFLIKEIVIKSIREFFYTQDFHEVVMPVFNTALPLEPNLYAFETIWNLKRGEKKFYLSTSPEAELKKMIGCGMGNCFSIGKSFRNLEDSGVRHSPEFLMLEWYRENADYTKIMKDVEELFFYVKKRVDSYLSRQEERVLDIGQNKIKISNYWERKSMIDLFAKYAKINLLDTLTDRNMQIVARQKGYETKNANFEQLFNQIFLNEIESHFSQEPFFLYDFPARISPLCAVKTKESRLAERFEVYIAGMELGNGNTENTDYKEVEKAFKEEEKNRKKRGEICPPIDMDFLKALKKMQNKTFAGIGLGVDRLTMVLGGIKDIKELNNQ
jgi:elongation factor P--beta-lysine ligase